MHIYFHNVDIMFECFFSETLAKFDTFMIHMDECFNMNNNSFDYTFFKGNNKMSIQFSQRCIFPYPYFEMPMNIYFINAN